LRAGEQEIELKFAVAPELGETIMSRPEFADRVVSRRLVSTYFDSAEHALLRAGYTLRVRHEDGRWVQTLKSCVSGDGAVRDEWSLPIRRGAPELSLLPCKAAIDAMVGEAAVAMFSVDVERRSIALDAPGCQVEVSLDNGSVNHAGRSAPIRELELELRAGRRAAFFAFARSFRDRYGLRPAFVSKAARGFELCAGALGGARRFGPPPVSADMTAGEAFKAAARAALTQIAQNAELLRTTSATPPHDVEVVHQLRVGLRRLRSLIRAFRPIVGDGRARIIRDRLKGVASDVASAREADVLLTGAFAQARWGAADASRATFARRLRAARKAAYDRARAAVDDDAFSALLLETIVWIEGGPWTASRAAGAAGRDAPIGPFATRSLESGYRRVLRRGRRFNSLDPEARHALRIAAKTLRYSADVFGPLFEDHPKRRRRFTVHIKMALDAMGELNDLVSTPPWCETWPGPILAWRASRQSLAATAGAKALRGLAKTKPFW